MTRKMVLTWLVASIFVPVVVVGSYFALRDSAADHLRFLLIARTVGMTKQQADQLERNVKSAPKSFADRMELLYFYSFRKSSPDGLSPDELANRRQHILWVIANEPSSGFAGDPAMEFYPKDEEVDTEGLDEARKLWLVQVHTKPSDARRMYNAGEFFSSIHDYPQSEMLLERARTIDPAAFDVTLSLATDYWHDTRYSATGAERFTHAKEALGVFEQALKMLGGSRKDALFFPGQLRLHLRRGTTKRLLHGQRRC